MLVLLIRRLAVCFAFALVLVYLDFFQYTFRIVKFSYKCSFLCVYKEMNQRKAQLIAVEARHAQPKSKKDTLILGSLL